MTRARDTAAVSPNAAPSLQLSPTAPYLAMQGIVKRFGATVALDRVDFAVERGEIHALLGENGAGKSTLMHVLSGLTRPDTGNIRLGGSDVRFASPRQARAAGIAMVHQHFTLVPAFTVAENLALDRPAVDPLERASNLGWTLDPNARVSDLPVGAQQRVEIVKALATDASLLIFDEPTAVLSPAEVKELFAVLRRLRAEGRTVILIAHKLAEILAVSDQVTVLRRGKNVATTLTAETNATQLAEWMVGSADSLAAFGESGEVVTVCDFRVVPSPPTPLPDSVAALPGRGETDTGLYSQQNREAMKAGNEPFPALDNRQKESGQPGLAGTTPNGENRETMVSPLPGSAATESGRGVGGEGTTRNEYDTNTARESGVRVSGLGVRGDRGEMAIRELSLTVRRGEICGIGGVDGNGQTELAEALAGLRKIESGEIRWNGGAFQAGVLPHIGYIPQDRRRAGLAVTMTIEENLLLDAVGEPAYHVGPFLKRRALRQLAANLITQFDVRTSDARLPASALSGGNQQKIVVARAFRSEPELIIAVNPTRGLDIGATRFVHEQLRHAKERGAAVVLISTDLDELAALADRTAILSAGQLTEYHAEDSHAADIGLLLGGMGEDGRTTNDERRTMKAAE